MYKFKTKPWEHQLRALDYMIIRDQAALYTDMGSGKTKVALDLINNRGFQKTLIVTTKKGCDVWEDEIKIHLYEEEYTVGNLTHYSTRDKFAVFDKCLKSEKPIIFIINYESIWRDPVKFTFKDMELDCIICDESHRIKDPGTKCSKGLTFLSKFVQHRYLLTGTPSTGKPIDVYSQYRFLDSSIFGTNASKFRKEFENVDYIRTAYAGYRMLDKEQPYKNLDVLKEKMYQCAFKCTADLKLPETVDIVRTFTPSTKTCKLYKELTKNGVLIGEKGILDTKNALTKVLRLQQLLSGYMPVTDETFSENFIENVDDSRIELLKELIEGISPDDKIVIFARFIYDFNKIKDLCTELDIAYGEISGRQNDYKKWQKGEIRLLVVNFQSGSESISLVEARYCIYYTLFYSYAMYAQSRKRIHRPGQDKVVTYYHIVAQIPKVSESIDESIMEALKNKKNVVDYLLNKEA